MFHTDIRFGVFGKTPYTHLKSEEHSMTDSILIRLTLHPLEGELYITRNIQKKKHLITIK